MIPNWAIDRGITGEDLDDLAAGLGEQAEWSVADDQTITFLVSGGIKGNALGQIAWWSKQHRVFWSIEPRENNQLLVVLETPRQRLRGRVTA